MYIKTNFYAPNTRVEPNLIVYHTSNYSFDNFDLAKIGSGFGASNFEYGFYFTDYIKTAKNMEKKQIKNIIYTVNINNVDLLDWYNTLIKEQEEKIINELDKKGLTPK